MTEGHGRTWKLTDVRFILPPAYPNDRPGESTEDERDQNLMALSRGDRKDGRGDW